MPLIVEIEVITLARLFEAVHIFFDLGFSVGRIAERGPVSTGIHRSIAGG